METKNFLKYRISTRDYKDEKLDEDTSKKIYEIVNNEAEKLGKENLAFLLNTDGDSVYKALNGVAGYGGVMIKAPAYIAIDARNNDPATIVKGAYGAESIITELSKLGLGSCWITVSEVDELVKQTAFSYSEGDINILLAVGFPLDNAKHEHSYFDRGPTEDLVFLGDFDSPATDEDLKYRGLGHIFDYAKFAPSTNNGQPWRFLIVDDEMRLYIKDYKGYENLIDAGIMMYYIDELSKAYAMPLGFEVDPKIGSDTYTYIGMTKM